METRAWIETAPVFVCDRPCRIRIYTASPVHLHYLAYVFSQGSFCGATMRPDRPLHRHQTITKPASDQAERVAGDLLRGFYSGELPFVASLFADRLTEARQTNADRAPMKLH